MSKDAIKFYEGAFYLLSNFSAHRVLFERVEYMTAEHAYQATKFDDATMREKIRNAPSAFLAHEWAQAKEGRKPNWEENKVSVMKEVMRAKALQHEDVRAALLSTEDRMIEKNHPLDIFWGTGEDGTGENIMGKIWMEIRDEIK